MMNKGFDKVTFGSGHNSTTVNLNRTYSSVDEFLDDLRRSSPTYQALASDVEKIDKEMEEMMKRKR